MKAALYVYFKRVWIRSRGIPRGVIFICEMLLAKPHTRSTQSLIDEFCFYFKEPWWALTHFPTGDGEIRSWLEHS